MSELSETKVTEQPGRDSAEPPEHHRRPDGARPLWDFDCQQCGYCCFGKGGVRLTLAEAEETADYLRIGLSELKRLYLADGEPPWEVRVGPEGYCLFHQPQNGQCLIHAVKPAICRLWPFFPGPLKDESAFIDARESCPGLPDDLSWEDFKAAGAEHGQD